MSDASIRVVGEPSPRSRWLLTVCPSAGEGGGCYVGERRRLNRPGVPNPERAREEAARRGKKRLRYYCSSNRLNRLGTLTYAPPFCTDPSEVRRHAGVFFRNLRGELGGRPFPYAWVPEFHQDGTRFHLHFAVGRYIKRSVIDEAWGHGFIKIILLGDLPTGSGRLEEARKAAGYLGKYVTKSFSDTRIPGRHRYDVAQGFQPEFVRVWGRSAVDVVETASGEFFGGALPARTWNSSEVQGWNRPPAIKAQWS